MAKLTTLTWSGLGAVTGKGLGAATLSVLVDEIGNVPDALTGRGVLALTVTVVVSIT
jgi:hypothetical protein